MKVIILLSGGIDSMACLYFYLSQGYDVECLFIDYSQKALKEEITAAKKISEHYRVKFSFIKIPKLSKTDQGEISGRNALFALCALGKYGYGTYKIALGIHDGTSYSDCSQEFVKRINSLFDLYCNGTIIIEAPFIKWKKTQIVSYCKKQCLPLYLTYSCENGGKVPCGECNSCLDRKVLLNE